MRRTELNVASPQWQLMVLGLLRQKFADDEKDWSSRNEQGLPF